MKIRFFFVMHSNFERFDDKLSSKFCESAELYEVLTEWAQMLWSRLNICIRIFILNLESKIWDKILDKFEAMNLMKITKLQLNYWQRVSSLCEFLKCNVNFFKSFIYWSLTPQIVTELCSTHKLHKFQKNFNSNFEQKKKKLRRFVTSFKS